MFTPFISVRGDVAAMKIDTQPGVANYIPTGENNVLRTMPTVGLEYRYPLISVQPWRARPWSRSQLIFRPNESNIGTIPNEDAQSLIFDDSNLFKINKFSGWDQSKAAAGRTSASNTPRNSTAAATSTCCSASPTSSSVRIPSRSAARPIPACRRASIPRRPTTWRARTVPAEFDLYVHVTLPFRPVQFHPATHRARNLRSAAGRHL